MDDMTSHSPQDSPTWPPAPIPAQPTSPGHPSGAAYPGVPQPYGPQDASRNVVDRVWTVMSNTKRRGDWVVPERIVLPVALGDVYVDLREARLTAPITTIEVQGLMGEVKIVVPESVRVECSGSAIVGEFHDVPSEQLPAPGAGAPVVRVVGAMIMGQVRVFRTADAVGEGGYAIDGMAGWRAKRRRRKGGRGIAN